MSLVLKRCVKCGALVEVLKDCTCSDCGIVCCGEQMKTLTANTTDAAFEKHVPQFEVQNNLMRVFVNHVMENDHHIEWIGVLCDNKLTKVFFRPGDKPEAVFHYQKGAKLYAFCNKHFLWENVAD